jgi:integrase
MAKKDKRSISVDVLRRLWSKYTKFRSGQLAISTVKRDYRRIEQRLQRLQKEAPTAGNAIAIRDWLLERYSNETTRRTLVQLNACCKWAMESDLITRNPFVGVASQLRQPRRSEKAWAAFTRQERDIIIQEFDVQYPWAGPWVKFLFWTGCRPEEAAALRWEHVSIDCREILITEALPVDMKEAQATKNYKITRFPCNARLQRLIREQRPQAFESAAYVLPSRKGGRFDYHNFQSRYWKPLVKALHDEGRIAFYLSEYHCRHTFITEGLREGISVQDMAYLCRVSTTVLYKHYLDRTRSITIPEF